MGDIEEHGDKPITSTNDNADDGNDIFDVEDCANEEKSSQQRKNDHDSDGENLSCQRNKRRTSFAVSLLSAFQQNEFRANEEESSQQKKDAFAPTDDEKNTHTVDDTDRMENDEIVDFWMSR